MSGRKQSPQGTLSAKENLNRACPRRRLCTKTIRPVLPSKLTITKTVRTTWFANLSTLVLVKRSWCERGNVLRNMVCILCRFGASSPLCIGVGGLPRIDHNILKHPCPASTCVVHAASCLAVVLIGCHAEEGEEQEEILNLSSYSDGADHL